MIADTLAKLLGVLVVNWVYVMAIQFVLFFRQIIRKILKQIANAVVTVLSGVFTSVLILFMLVILLTYLLGKEGGMSISAYGEDHLFPALLMICLEFAEFLILLCQFKVYENNHLYFTEVVEIEYEISEKRRIVSEFEKPNMAFLQ